LQNENKNSLATIDHYLMGKKPAIRDEKICINSTAKEKKIY
jgi:hypothetical protein